MTVRPANAKMGKRRRTVLRNAAIAVAFTGLLLGQITGRADATAPAAAPSPWTNYNEGVQAYARHDYADALQRWQDLSLEPLPRGLRRQVWFQLGNAEFRLGEPLEANTPEQAAELWRRSSEDYRVVLTARPRDAATRHNLALVERRLARLLQKLGNESFASAKDRPLDDAINRLTAATEDLNEAVTLAPQDREIRADRDRADQALREKLLERARQTEAQGDDAARQENAWSEQRAEEQYRNALEDLANARREPAEKATPPMALDQSVAQAEERVTRKLAELLTRMGQREQKEGRQASQWNPDQALDHYETALDRFQAAQELQPGNEAARQGEREVRAAMEQLHVREGQNALQQGREALRRQDPVAAPELTTALGHFEAALELNSGNAEAAKGAAEARRLLPEALALAGQEEMQAGDRAEPDSPSDALGHYQQSETQFQEALELKPGHSKAEKGLREVEPKLARLRDKLAKQAESANQANQPHQPAQSLQNLLGQVNERERDTDAERQRQRARKDTNSRKHYPDW
jgi:hypothetical protein